MEVAFGLIKTRLKLAIKLSNTGYRSQIATFLLQTNQCNWYSWTRPSRKSFNGQPGLQQTTTITTCHNKPQHTPRIYNLIERGCWVSVSKVTQSSPQQMPNKTKSWGSRLVVHGCWDCWLCRAKKVSCLAPHHKLAESSLLDDCHTDCQILRWALALFQKLFALLSSPALLNHAQGPMTRVISPRVPLF